MDCEKKALAWGFLLAGTIIDAFKEEAHIPLERHGNC
jgi:hypothetical protein